MDGTASPLAAPPFLGVERSVCGRRWRVRVCDDNTSLLIAERLGRAAETPIEIRDTRAELPVRAERRAHGKFDAARDRGASVHETEELRAKVDQIAIRVPEDSEAGVDAAGAQVLLQPDLHSC